MYEYIFKNALSVSLTGTLGEEFVGVPVCGVDPGEFVFVLWDIPCGVLNAVEVPMLGAVDAVRGCP